MTFMHSVVGTIGMATIDHLYVVPTYPAPDSENKVTHYAPVVGGPAGRSAIAAARLGGRVKLMATCGMDSNASLLREQIETEGIDATWIEFPQPSQQSAIIVGTEEASRATFWLPQPMADARMVACLPDFLADLDVVLLDSTDEHLTRAALDVCEELGVTTVIDTGSGRPWAGPLLSRVDYVICPEKYLIKQWGAAGDDILRDLAAEHCRVAFGVTRGPDGGRFARCGSGEIETWEAAPVEAVDTCGAGDTFHGAFAWAIAHGHCLESAFDLAAWSAGLKVAATGNEGIPSLVELDAARSQRVPLLRS